MIHEGKLLFFFNLHHSSSVTENTCHS